MLTVWLFFSMVSALGASWGSLGTFLAHLVGLLVALGASLGASWDLLGLLGRLLVPLGASLGPCWGLLVVWRLLDVIASLLLLRRMDIVVLELHF